MNKVGAAIIALSLSAPSLAWAQEPPPPPPAAPQVVVVAPPPPMMVAPPPPMMTEPPPSSGVGLLVAGGVFTGLGVLNMATAPLCKSITNLSDSGQQTCFVASLVLGGVFLATGIPLLIVGGIKRSAYKEWKAQHPVASGFDFSAGKSSGLLTWRAAF